MQTYTNAGDELDTRVHAYADKRGISYADAMRHVAAVQTERGEKMKTEVRRYDYPPEKKGGVPSRCCHLDRRTDRMVCGECEEENSITRTEEVSKMLDYQANESHQIDAEVQRYMREHRENEYATALRAVLKRAGEKRAEAHAELGRRIPAYQSHFGIKTYEKAKDLVLDHDAGLASKVGGKRQPLRPSDVVDVRAKQYAREHKVSYGEAMKEVLYQDDRLAMCYELNLPYVEGGDVRDYADSKPGAIQRLGALLGGAKDDRGSLDLEFALRVGNLAPDLVKQAAGERLVALANQFIISEGMPGFHADNFAVALRRVRQDHPELTASAESGRLNETALKEILFSWNWPSA